MTDQGDIVMERESEEKVREEGEEPKSRIY